MLISRGGSDFPDIISLIPGDKSISHRAIIIGSLSKGSVTFKGFLCSDDCLHTLDIFKKMGVDIQRNGDMVMINSQGVQSFVPPTEPLFVGNSGTGIRLITGVLAALPFNSVITGDASIEQRPMDRITGPLTKMGALFELKGGRPPIQIIGGRTLSSMVYDMPIASAQVKSAILLAGVTAGIPVTINEPVTCRNHTECMLRLFNANVDSKNGEISLKTTKLKVPDEVVQIPADISSALFFICYALLSNQAVTLTNIGLNPSRTGCLSILKDMGAPIKIEYHQSSYESMGDIIVNHIHEPLNNVVVPKDMIPNIIDELPILAVLATKAKGTFSVRGAQELRIKESDRIDGICRLMRALKVPVKEVKDGFDIGGSDIEISSFEYDSQFDHRLAMSSIIAAKSYGIDANILGTDSISTSFPNFFEMI